MAEKVKVASKSEVQPGSGKVIKANGIEIALFNSDGKFYALQNECAHERGPLGEGFLSGKCVTCPLHAWEFDIQTGESITMPGAKVKTFKVTVEGEDVFVEV